MSDSGGDVGRDRRDSDKRARAERRCNYIIAYPMRTTTVNGALGSLLLAGALGAI